MTIASKRSWFPITIKIKQSYHGTGGREGYKFTVYDIKNKKLGTLLELPVKCRLNDVVAINKKLYKITKIYDSDDPMDEENEVVFYELETFVFKPDYDLGKVVY